MAREPWQEEIAYRESLDEYDSHFEKCSECDRALVDGGYHIALQSGKVWLCEECLKDIFWVSDCEVQR